MLWFIIALFMTAILVIFLPFTKDFYGNNRHWGHGIGWGFFLLLVALGLNLACMQVGYQATVKETFSAPLAALQDGQSGTHGSFFLGIGSFSGGSPAYNYYERDKDGSYSLQQIDTDYDTVRVFQDDSTPRVVCRSVVRIHNHGPELSVFGALVNTTNACTTWDFHVPPGSIVHNYTLDAK